MSTQPGPGEPIIINLIAGIDRPTAGTARWLAMPGEGSPAWHAG
jgi:hypothetical protein